MTKGIRPTEIAFCEMTESIRLTANGFCPRCRIIASCGWKGRERKLFDIVLINFIATRYNRAAAPEK